MNKLTIAKIYLGGSIAYLPFFVISFFYFPHLFEFLVFGPNIYAKYAYTESLIFPFTFFPPAILLLIGILLLWSFWQDTKIRKYILVGCIIVTMYSILLLIIFLSLPTYKIPENVFIPIT